MIKTNMKIGDRFVDGGREFEVLEVVEHGYISKQVGIYNGDTEDREKELKAMKLDELIKLCNEKGIPSIGKKSELIERILETEKE